MTHDVYLKYYRDYKTWTIRYQIELYDDAVMTKVAAEVMTAQGVETSEVTELKITPISSEPWWKFWG